MSTYYAYGIDLSKDYFKFKKNAAELLWNKAKTIDWVQEASADYCEDNDLDPDGGFYDEFIDLILYCWLGLILLGLFWFNLGMNYSRSSQEPETITVI